MSRLPVQRSAQDLQTLIRLLAADNREWVVSGIVQTSAIDASWGLRLTVTLPDGRDVECRPLWLGADGGAGQVWDIPKGAEVLIFCPGGDVNAGVALLGPASTQQHPADDWNRENAIYPDVYIGEKGHQRERVLTRTLLDDLAEYLTDLIAFLAAYKAMTTTVQTSTSGGAWTAGVAAVAAVGGGAGAGFTAGVTASFAAIAGTGSTAETLRQQAVAWLVLVNLARQGEGSDPYCSPSIVSQQPIIPTP